MKHQFFRQINYVGYPVLRWRTHLKIYIYSSSFYFSFLNRTYIDQVIYPNRKIKDNFIYLITRVKSSVPVCVIDILYCADVDNYLTSFLLCLIN
jgi:hypothetical protein